MSRWYKRNGADFIAGTMGLSLEAKGAYSLCLDLIYDRGGAIPDDARYLAGVCNVSVRRWTALRDSLIAAGKLYVIDGKLSNRRADAEILSAEFRAKERAESGAKGGNKRAENASTTPQNSHLAEAELKHLREDKIRGDETSSSPAPRKRAGGVKSSRISESWKPEKPYPDDVRSIVDSWPAATLDKRLREFVDYWLSRGRDATKVDWDRTWWNRIRDVDEHMAQKRGAEPPVEQPIDSLDFDKSAEVSQIADFRRRLAIAVGAGTYKQWVDPLILQFGEGRLSVLALSSVAREHVRNTHGSHFDRIAKQVFGPDAVVAWTAEPRKVAA